MPGYIAGFRPENERLLRVSNVSKIYVGAATGSVTVNIAYRS